MANLARIQARPFPSLRVTNSWAQLLEGLNLGVVREDGLGDCYKLRAD